MVLNNNEVTFFATNADCSIAVIGSKRSYVKVTALATSLDDVERRRELSAKFVDGHVPFLLILAYTVAVGSIWLKWDLKKS